MIPYIKGFHLTAKMWRGNRDANGWKLHTPPSTDRPAPSIPDDDDDTTMVHLVRKAVAEVQRAPADGVTPPAPRLHADLLAL